METTRSSRILRIAREVAGRKSAGAEEGAESGFTLIELMVVLLIMAILLAIAIPTFLGVKGGAQNRATQSDLTNAVTSAKAVFTNQGSYGLTPAALVASLLSAEPELSFVNGVVSNAVPHEISVAINPIGASNADGEIMILAEQAANGTCWYAQDNEESTTTATGGLTIAFTGAGSQGISYSSTHPASAATGCNALTVPIAGANWGASYPSS